MPAYKQAERALAITTPLGEDQLLLTAIRGFEGISELFRFRLDLLAEADAPIPFDEIVGQNVTIELRLAAEGKRYFNGIVKSLSQGPRDESFTHFHAELVPQFWLLTKRVRSRIFQHLPVPEILHRVLAGLDVAFELSGAYLAREYCVQYRESDFDFASRLMEEEGIYYFFKHADGSHNMVVSDASNRHPSVPGASQVIYDEASVGAREDARIRGWEKTQELRSGVYTLWDHCFELPGKNLEAKERTIDSITVGKTTHKLHVGGNDQLEIYDYPGGYAHRFGGIDRSGGPRPQALKHIVKDAERTARIRMEQEEINCLRIEGQGGCSQFVAGYTFTLERHFDADGDYLLTRVEHDARLGEGSYRSGDASTFHYENHFTCVPVTLSYRPQRVTRRPVIAGTQTATVVGAPGQEIFCDKYGRVKVQFHWDREGKKNADSSCWLRVAQVWAGKGWGAFFWPRIGHEVVVTFEEGDPDRPMIIGSVYNAENMPWFALPLNKQLSGFKSASLGGKAHKNFNGIVFNDRTGVEHLAIHSERNLNLHSENDKMIHGGRHQGERVGVANLLTVGKLLPGGGSGGGDFNQGNPLPAPPPTGVMGLNSVVTFGENLQFACPVNHQIALGNNLQLCINPIGLLAGRAEMPLPGVVSAVFGGALGGNMQFTIGANAQFTLGQSFEISVGPPKVEIHTGYDGHAAVKWLCAALTAATVAFVLAYELSAHTQTFHQPSQSSTDEEVTAEQHAEQPGDKTRTALVLAYQIIVNALLVAIMGAESIYDKSDWFVHDTMKEIYSTAAKFGVWKQPEESPVPSEWGALGWGSALAVGMVAAEIASDAAQL